VTTEEEAELVEPEEFRRDTQWDLDFRACVAGILAREDSEDSSYEIVIGSAVDLADQMRVKRANIKRPAGPPESEIRRRYRLLVDVAREVQEVFQRRDMQACQIPIALSRALDDLFDELNEKKKES